MRLGIGFNRNWAAACRGTVRIVAGAVAMTAGSFAFTGVQPDEGSAAPAPAVTLLPATTITGPADTVSTTPPPETTTAPPPDTVTTTAPPETVTTTAPPETVTTTAPPETATAPLPPPPTTTTAPPRAAADAGPSPQQQAEAIADTSGWNWRAAGVRIIVAFHPQDCCHWGVYDSPSRTLYIGPSAFGNASRLRYVVLHELGHAWQYQTGKFRELIADYKPFGMTTAATALEAGGDCIAAVWGASDHHYWVCPAEAKATAARRLAGDWH